MEEKIGERIKELRRTLNLNQTEFGAKVGLKQTSIAGYETGARMPLDTVIIAICREFNVSETWLRTGEGEMFRTQDETDAELVTRAMRGESENKKKLIRLIADMPDELLDKMMEYLESKMK